MGRSNSRSRRLWVSRVLLNDRLHVDELISLSDSLESEVVPDTRLARFVGDLARIEKIFWQIELQSIGVEREKKRSKRLVEDGIRGQIRVCQDPTQGHGVYLAIVLNPNASVLIVLRHDHVGHPGSFNEGLVDSGQLQDHHHAVATMVDLPTVSQSESTFPKHPQHQPGADQSPGSQGYHL